MEEEEGAKGKMVVQEEEEGIIVDKVTKVKEAEEEVGVKVKVVKLTVILKVVMVKVIAKVVKVTVKV